MIECIKCGQIIGELKMKKHLKKCKASKNENISSNDIITPRIWKKQNVKASEIPENVLQSISKKVENIWNDLNMENQFPNMDINISEKYHDFLFKHFKEEQLKSKNRYFFQNDIYFHISKHLLQEVSIIGHMQKEGILLEDALYIEFGCGVGSLSRNIQLACNSKSSHLLVDRMNFRSTKKYDLDLSFNSDFVKRLVVDIKDLNLEEYKNRNFVIGCSKHLCGNACDLTLEKSMYYKKRIYQK